MGTLKLQSNGPSYSNMVIGTPTQSPPRCTKHNSPPINGQCTNFILFNVALQLPLNCKELNKINCQQMSSAKFLCKIHKGVEVLLVQLMVDLLPMWMWMAPNWMRKPPSAIWATCFQLVVVAITLLLLAVVRPGASSESCCQSSLQSTSLSRHAARCSQLVFGQLCSMAVRPGPQTPPIYNDFAEMTVP